MVADNGIGETRCVGIAVADAAHYVVKFFPQVIIQDHRMTLSYLDWNKILRLVVFQFLAALLAAYSRCFGVIGYRRCTGF